jgi:vancomycin permeability regulator SanA
MIREKFARAKVFWDFLFSVQPKFGGEKILLNKHYTYIVYKIRKAGFLFFLYI